MGDWDEKRVAIKVQSKEKLVFNGDVSVAIEERKFLSAFRSNFIVGLFGKFKDERNVYLYMQFAELGTLSEVWEYMKGNLGEQRENDLLNFVSQIVCALGYIHACGVIYRDLKPLNCLVSNMVVSELETSDCAS